MLTSNPTNVDEIVTALQQLGGEALAKDIKDQVTKNRGGMPPQYARRHSYRETIQKLIEDYCPQSSNFRGTAYFERVDRGRYKIIVDRQNKIDDMISEEEQEYITAGVFAPKDFHDDRERTLASIVRRRGQPKFRRMLLQIYDSQCAITGSDAEQALEAAHIDPYKDQTTNTPNNGLLLRADIHTLFDLWLIAIDSKTMTVLVAPTLKSSVYGQFHGTSLRLPTDLSKHPSKTAIDEHRRNANF